ncbi:MAG TPA: Clp protease N-terminal domain-containing protein [Candidatus Sulfotelmatobacter sp.]|nr:Clp protease N-terminal domain-containing protein [Candidatus Sulfotelmatobacter sp.]
MFERYTEKARRVIFFARYEASQFGSPVIDTEHLLLGMLREEKSLHRWLPKTDHAAIRRQVEDHLPKQPSTPTATDLPLSRSAQRVLRNAADEADRLANKQIGTEHLFLSLLEEKDCFAAKLLQEAGADAIALRTHYAEKSQPAKPLSFQRASYRDFGFRALSAETVEIHGSRWNVDYVRDAVQLCREYNWHWHRAVWAERDVAVHTKTGRVSFDLRLAASSADFKLVKGGWKKDYCFICHWELFQSEDEHGTGYTNGHDWLCMECYERFWEHPNFFSSSHSDIT